MTEAGHVQDLLMRLALSHPEVAFTFINNGQTKMRTSGNGKLKDVIYSIYGREAAANLIELDYSMDGLVMKGYLGKPVITRGNRNFENYFVNGRYVKNEMLSKAIEDAYKDFLMQHKFPFVVIHFQVDGEKIDVNVHPTKMEMRFQRQQDVYNIVYEGVHRTLLEPELIPQVEAPAPKVISQPKSESPFLLKPKTFNSSLLKYGGDLAVGAMTILSSIMQFAMLPLQGITQGGQPIISYNYGAKKIDRIKQAFKLQTISCVVYATIIWLIAEFAPSIFVSIFTSDPQLAELSQWALRI